MAKHNPLQGFQIRQQLLWRHVKPFRHYWRLVQYAFGRLGNKVQHIHRHVSSADLVFHTGLVRYRLEGISIICVQNFCARRFQ